MYICRRQSVIVKLKWIRDVVEPLHGYRVSYMYYTMTICNTRISILCLFSQYICETLTVPFRSWNFQERFPNSYEDDH